MSVVTTCSACNILPTISVCQSPEKPLMCQGHLVHRIHSNCPRVYITTLCRISVTMLNSPGSSPLPSCSFAIDWRPAQRMLVYLKSASLVCSLEVEEGYPSKGRARLGSIRREAQLIDTSVLQVPFSTHI